MEVRTSPKYQKFMRPGKTIERIRNSKDFFRPFAGITTVTGRTTMVFLWLAGMQGTMAKIISI